jgi:hypothetical protein
MFSPSTLSSMNSSRRSAMPCWRVINPLRTSRSHIRVAVDGLTSRRVARSNNRWGPLRNARSVRNCAAVTSSVVSETDRARAPSMARPAAMSAWARSSPASSDTDTL